MWSDSQVGSDTRSVSPIIGVILKVGITVILAAIVATVALSIVEDTDPGPNVTLETVEEPDNGTIQFVHAGGDTVERDALSIRGAGKLDESETPAEITAGESIVVTDIAAGKGDAITVRWQTETGDNSAQLERKQLTTEYTAATGPADGSVEIVATDIEPTDDNFDVRTFDYANMTAGYLVVRNVDTGDEATFEDIGETTVTVDTDSLNPDANDEIRAELYPSSDRSNLLASDSRIVTSGGGGPGFTIVTVVLSILIATLISRRRDDEGETE